MKKIATFIIVIMGLFGLASAQGDYEALTFSQFDYWGTARFVGAGGAFGATGGDFSALSTNPAAIGLFNSVINMIMLIIVNAISGKLSSTSLW